jgi:hypothetical protein
LCNSPHQASLYYILVLEVQDFIPNPAMADSRVWMERRKNKQGNETLIDNISCFNR